MLDLWISTNTYLFICLLSFHHKDSATDKMHHSFLAQTLAKFYINSKSKYTFSSYMEGYKQNTRKKY